MIKNAWGTINGCEVTLSRIGDSDRWKVVVPSVEDGTYTCEFFAENSGGKQGYFCSVLFVVSGHRIVSSRIIRGYEGKIGRLRHGC